MKFDIYKWGILFEWLRHDKEWKRIDIIFALHFGTTWDVFKPQKNLTLRLVVLKFKVKEGVDYGIGFDIPISKIKR